MSDTDHAEKIQELVNRGREITGWYTPDDQDREVDAINAEITDHATELQAELDVAREALAAERARVERLQENRDQMYRAMTNAQERATKAEDELVMLKLKIKYGDLPTTKALNNDGTVIES